MKIRNENGIQTSLDMLDAGDVFEDVDGVLLMKTAVVHTFDDGTSATMGIELVSGNGRLYPDAEEAIVNAIDGEFVTEWRA